MPGGAKAVIRETETDGIHLFPCPTPLGPPWSTVDPGSQPPARLRVDFALGGERAFSSIRLHYERLSHSAAHISLPTSRRNVCRDADQIALSISDACSAPPLVPPFPSVPLSIVALPPPRSAAT